jgi:hypothetical protein
MEITFRLWFNAPLPRHFFRLGGVFRSPFEDPSRAEKEKTLLGQAARPVVISRKRCT